MTTLRTRLRALLATGTLLAIVAGLPLVLLAIGASPIPHSMPSLETIKSALSCLLYTSPSPRDRQKSRMPSSA